MAQIKIEQLDEPFLPKKPFSMHVRFVSDDVSSPHNSEQAFGDVLNLPSNRGSESERIRRQYTEMINPGQAPIINTQTLTTNRPKAILFVNLFVFFQILYAIVIKVSINDMHIHPLDISLIRVSVLLTISLITALCFNNDFKIPKGQKSIILCRSLSATIALTSITFGIAMVPIVVQTTIFNTAPFWTTFLAWCVLGDKISCFEIVAMIISFGGVVLIALSSTHEKDEEEQQKELETRSTKFFTG